jgi:hypothetical protein
MHVGISLVAQANRSSHKIGLISLQITFELIFTGGSLEKMRFLSDESSLRKGAIAMWKTGFF